MILVVGLSPAWQRTLHYERVALGEVNRARCLTEIASGKGVNVARVARQLGADVLLLTVAGGHRGELLKRSLAAQKIPTSVVRVSGETRICQTLIAGDTATELVEEAPPLKRCELAQVLQAFDRRLHHAKLVALSGSVPMGCGDNFYARLVAKARRAGVPALIDAQGPHLLTAVKHRPFLVRINRRELASATGSRGLTLPHTRAAAGKLLDKGAGWVVISHGRAEVLAISQDGSWILQPPPIRAANPIGSGDAMLAGIACALLNCQPMLDALRLGVACGAANATTWEPGTVRLACVRRLLEQVTIIKMK